MLRATMMRVSVLCVSMLANFGEHNLSDISMATCYIQLFPGDHATQST